ncbi:unnamed protein product [Bursaphelenchus xylophilus]|uniref:(pine wood nematode) hypothetical protein n=1 Tax=Bursaphelenchus xylophilus TaxID=6326 RepID=A0A1I7RPT2_BURXY|nr:unnamed protein product [Bursaphelenchus xylophilus]CAG9096569.1 unnamed protein product [Bursaphelenchus xylophilus]
MPPKMRSESKKSSAIHKPREKVERRNARERQRVKQVNAGYEYLGQMLNEWELYKNKKLTKADTLKAAIQYIKHLESLLGPSASKDQSSSSVSAVSSASPSPFSAIQTPNQQSPYQPHQSQPYPPQDSYQMYDIKSEVSQYYYNNQQYFHQ